MPRETDLKQTLCADNNGFSLHAAVRCAADDRQALEQLCRFHGVLAPNAKLRALVVPLLVPQEPEVDAQEAMPAECEANCAHHRPLRLSWAKLLKRV
ncbi:MAG: hypothetical protein Q8K96_01550, partial [Rubrivivax sp.]|nr:hypothetical protein [Rubrivivax sp.]